MDKKLERLINAVIEKAVDGSEASEELVYSLCDYFNNTSRENAQYLGEVLDALKCSAEKGCSFAMLYFVVYVYQYSGMSVEQKELAIRYGAQCGYLRGYYFSALLLMEDDVFRPRDYFYNWRGGLFGSHMLNEPDRAMREAARRFQFVVDRHPEPAEGEQYPDWVLDSAVKAARLNLNKRGFGPGLPIGDEELALSDLDFVMEHGEGEQFAHAAATKGAYLLMKNRETEAADYLIAAIESYPDSVIDFACEHMHEKRDVYDRVLAACEAAQDRMSQNGRGALAHGRANWLSY